MNLHWALDLSHLQSMDFEPSVDLMFIVTLALHCDSGIGMHVYLALGMALALMCMVTQALALALLWMLLSIAIVWVLWHHHCPLLNSSSLSTAQCLMMHHHCSLPNAS